MIEKKYIIKEGEVLVGSALLKKKDVNYHRVNYMVDNIQMNKSFDYLKKNSNEKDFQTLKKILIKKYLDYRNAWNNQPSLSIFNKLSSQEFKKNKAIPLCLDIETAALCDLACPFCFREYTATPDKIIDEKVCYDLIDQAADIGIPSIKFNWRGEPLLHPKLPDFIQYAKSKGILETIINTNATKS